jgi:hypothetical protein
MTTSNGDVVPNGLELGKCGDDTILQSSVPDKP